MLEFIVGAVVFGVGSLFGAILAQMKGGGRYDNAS